MLCHWDEKQGNARNRTWWWLFIKGTLTLSELVYARVSTEYANGFKSFMVNCLFAPKALGWFKCDVKLCKTNCHNLYEKSTITWWQRSKDQTHLLTPGQWNLAQWCQTIFVCLHKTSSKAKQFFTKISTCIFWESTCYETGTLYITIGGRE